MIEAIDRRTGPGDGGLHWSFSRSRRDGPFKGLHCTGSTRCITGVGGLQLVAAWWGRSPAGLGAVGALNVPWTTSAAARDATVPSGSAAPGRSRDSWRLLPHVNEGGLSAGSSAAHWAGEVNLPTPLWCCQRDHLAAVWAMRAPVNDEFIIAHDSRLMSDELDDEPKNINPHPSQYMRRPKRLFQTIDPPQPPASQRNWREPHEDGYREYYRRAPNVPESPSHVLTRPLC